MSIDMVKLKLLEKILIATFIVCFICWPVYAQDQMLKKGNIAPNFEALSHDGQFIQLSDLTTQGPVILVLLRGLT
jgi:hypothetical protein